MAKEGKWKAFLDEDTTGVIHYFNVDTGVNIWDPPTVTFPKIRMTWREKKRMVAIREDFAAKEKQKRYPGVAKMPYSLKAEIWSF